MKALIALTSRLVGTLALLASPAVHAADNVPPPPQKQALVITGATLHTVSGAVIANGRMLVERGRIRAIAAPGEALPAPQTGPAVELALPGRHIYPGFIAANSATGLVEVQAVRATVDLSEIGLVNPNARAVVALNADSEMMPVSRANGVLATLSVPGSGVFGSIAGTSALIQMDGWNWEDMALQPEVALHVVLPTMRTHSDVLKGSLEPLRDDIRKLSAQRLQQIEDAFDAAAAYARARKAEPGSPTDVRWEAMLPVLRGERPVFVHAHELAQIRHALGLAERHGFKLVIVGGMDAWRIAPVLKARGVAVVIGGVHELPVRPDDEVDVRYTLAARLAQAGVAFCIARSGSAFSAASERNLPYEAAAAAAHGLPRDEALKAITLYPAQILGVADRLGSLAVGRLASFIVTDGDPLEITTQVERVFIQGREVETGNRQTRLEQKYRNRYGQTPAR